MMWTRNQCIHHYQQQRFSVDMAMQVLEGAVRPENIALTSVVYWALKAKQFYMCLCSVVWIRNQCIHQQQRFSVAMAMQVLEGAVRPEDVALI